VNGGAYVNPQYILEDISSWPQSKPPNYGKSPASPPSTKKKGNLHSTCPSRSCRGNEPIFDSCVDSQRNRSPSQARTCISQPITVALRPEETKGKTYLLLEKSSNFSSVAHPPSNIVSHSLQHRTNNPLTLTISIILICSARNPPYSTPLRIIRNNRQAMI
jgi:hypothetical protein